MRVSQHPTGPDPIVNSDRITGTTEPEVGEEGNAVAGRPAGERRSNGFHVSTETKSTEKEPLNESEALTEGGSFDGVAPLQDIDAPDGNASPRP